MGSARDRDVVLLLKESDRSICTAKLIFLSPGLPIPPGAEGGENMENHIQAANHSAYKCCILVVKTKKSQIY